MIIHLTRSEHVLSSMPAFVALKTKWREHQAHLPRRARNQPRPFTNLLPMAFLVPMGRTAKRLGASPSPNLGTNRLFSQWAGRPITPELAPPLLDSVTAPISIAGADIKRP